MKVNGVQHVTTNVEIELDDKEIDRIIYATDSAILLKVIRDHLRTAFIKRISKDLKGPFGELAIYREHISSSSRFFSQVESEGAYPCLVHVDADHDYHNNVGVDETLRVLTPAEIAEWKSISEFKSEVMERLKF